MRQLEVFHAVMVAKSISGAARALQTSQPVVSRTIRRLEDRVAIRLFERRNGRLIPTTEALRIFGETEQIVSRMNLLERRLTMIASGHDELFRIGASPSISRYLAPVALRDVAGLAPGLTVFLDTLFSAETLDYVLSGPGECAVTTVTINHPAISSRKLGSGVLVAAIHRDHALARRSVLAPGDLKGEDMIGYIDESGPHGVASRSYLGDVTPRVRMYARFADSALALVNEGVGILLTDTFSVAGAQGRNVVVRPLTAPPTFTLNFYWNPDRPRSRHVENVSKAFIGAIRENRDVALD